MNIYMKLNFLYVGSVGVFGGKPVGRWQVGLLTTKFWLKGNCEWHNCTLLVFTLDFWKSNYNGLCFIEQMNLRDESGEMRESNKIIA